MALQITTGEIPKSAIALSPSEAIQYQWEQIQKWPKQSEVWPFRWGIAGVGIMSMVSGIYLNNHWRRQLKLRNYGIIATTIPMVFAPPLFSAVLHTQMITQDLFLNKTKCFVCLLNKAFGVQLGIGIVYPVLSVPLLTYMCANQYSTYRLPYWSDWRGHFNVFMKINTPISKQLLALIAMQILTVGFVTYQEAESLHKLRKKLLEEHKAAAAFQ